MKRKFLLNLLILIITSIFISSAIGMYYSYNAMNSILEHNKNDVIKHINSRVQIYDKILDFIEMDIIKKGRVSIKSIAAELNSEAKTNSVSKKELRQIADKNNVNEIYLVNDKGVIFNTTFPPDLNLNLFKIDEKFKRYLLNVYGKGSVFYPKLQTSALTGTLNMYMYYSPIQSNYIIDVSIKIKDFVKNNYSDDYYNFLFKDFFTPLLKENKYIKNLEIYHVTDYGHWSLINEGKKNDKDKKFWDRLNSEGEITYKSESSYIIYKTLKFDSAKFDWGHNQYLVMEYDFSTLNQYIKEIFIISLISSMLIMIIFYLVFSKLFEKNIISRIININDGIKEIANGNYKTDIKITGTDELSNIAANINKMSSIINGKITDLEKMLPICSSCKKIRDDKGFWNHVEEYFSDNSEMHFSHTMCPECLKKLYPNLKKSKE